MEETEALTRIRDQSRFPAAQRSMQQTFMQLSDQIQRQPASYERSVAMSRLAMAMEAMANLFAPKPVPARPQPTRPPQQARPQPAPAPQPVRPGRPQPAPAPAPQPVRPQPTRPQPQPPRQPRR